MTRSFLFQSPNRIKARFGSLSKSPNLGSLVPSLLPPPSRNELLFRIRLDCIANVTAGGPRCEGQRRLPFHFFCRLFFARPRLQCSVSFRCWNAFCNAAFFSPVCKPPASCSRRTICCCCPALTLRDSAGLGLRRVRSAPTQQLLLKTSADLLSGSLTGDSCRAQSCIGPGQADCGTTVDDYGRPCQPGGWKGRLSLIQLLQNAAVTADDDEAVGSEWANPDRGNDCTIASDFAIG